MRQPKLEWNTVHLVRNKCKRNLALRRYHWGQERNYSCPLKDVLEYRSTSMAIGWGKSYAPVFMLNRNRKLPPAFSWSPQGILDWHSYRTWLSVIYIETLLRHLLTRRKENCVRIHRRYFFPSSCRYLSGPGNIRGSPLRSSLKYSVHCQVRSLSVCYYWHMSYR